MSKQNFSRSNSGPSLPLRLLRALLLRLFAPHRDDNLISAHVPSKGSNAKGEVLAQFHAAEYASERNSVDVWKTLQYALIPIIFVAWSLLYQVREALSLELFRWAFAAVLPICYVAYQKAMVDALTGVLLIETRVRPRAIQLAGSDDFWFHEPVYRENIKPDAAYGWYWPPLLSFASPLAVLAYRVFVDRSFAKGDWWGHLATYGEVLGYTLCCGVAGLVGKLSKEGLALNRQIDNEIRRRKFKWLKERPRPVMKFNRGRKVMVKDKSTAFSGLKIEIPENRYRSDMDLHDRFQEFSAELLKLALAAIAVFGIFLTLLAGEDTEEHFRNILRSDQFRLLSLLALVALGASVALAMLHRFLASDGMYHHLRAIKGLVLLEEPGDNPSFDHDAHSQSIREEVVKDEYVRNKKFKVSEWCLRGSAVSIAIGAALLAASFWLLLLP